MEAGVSPGGNAATIAAYESHAREYLAGTPSVPLSIHGRWFQDAVGSRPAGSRILEIGSGPGHDAVQMEALGAEVDRTDAAYAFVAHLRGQGHEVRQLNLLEDEPGTGYGMVYAFAVFAHFTQEECRLALRKCFRALTPGGVLALSFRRGDGTYWRERKGMPPRRFTFWEPGPLWEAVEDAGFGMTSMVADTNVNQDADQEVKRWLLVTAVRP